MYLGKGPAGGPGTLSGGTNPDGILATIDNHCTAGVTFGCGAGNGSGVTTGVEWEVPLAAIGNPQGCIGVCALIYSSANHGITNQVLGPVPAGTCPLGAPAGVDFSTIPGNQFFTVCPLAVATRSSTWGTLKLRYH